MEYYNKFHINSKYSMEFISHIPYSIMLSPWDRLEMYIWRKYRRKCTEGHKCRITYSICSVYKGKGEKRVRIKYYPCLYTLYLKWSGRERKRKRNNLTIRKKFPHYHFSLYFPYLNIQCVNRWLYCSKRSWGTDYVNFGRWHSLYVLYFSRLDSIFYK